MATALSSPSIIDRSHNVLNNPYPPPPSISPYLHHREAASDTATERDRAAPREWDRLVSMPSPPAFEREKSDGVPGSDEHAAGGRNDASQVMAAAGVRSLGVGGGGVFPPSSGLEGPGPLVPSLSLLPSRESFLSNRQSSSHPTDLPSLIRSRSPTMPPFSRTSSSSTNPYSQQIGSTSASSSAANLSNLISPNPTDSPGFRSYDALRMSASSTSSSSQFYSSSSSSSIATTTPNPPPFSTLRPSFSSYSPTSQSASTFSPLPIKHEPSTPSSDLSLSNLYSLLETHSYPSRRSSLSGPTAANPSGRSRASSLMQNPIGYPPAQDQAKGRARSGSTKQKGTSTNPSSPGVAEDEEMEDNVAPPPVKGDAGASRRLAHLQCEQRRRESINGGFATLRSILPETTSADSKALILQKAINYIKHLEQSVRLSTSSTQQQPPLRSPIQPSSSLSHSSEATPRRAAEPYPSPPLRKRASPPGFMHLDLHLAKRPDPTFSRPSSPPVSKAVTPNEMDWRSRGELRAFTRDEADGMEIDMSDDESEARRGVRRYDQGRERERERERERARERERDERSRSSGRASGRMETPDSMQYYVPMGMGRHGSALDLLVGVAGEERARFVGGGGAGGGGPGAGIERASSGLGMRMREEDQKPSWAHYEREEMARAVI